jgi:hypothetical protein
VDFGRAFDRSIIVEEAVRGSLPKTHHATAITCDANWSAAYKAAGRNVPHKDTLRLYSAVAGHYFGAFEKKPLKKIGQSGSRAQLGDGISYSVFNSNATTTETEYRYNLINDLIISSQLTIRSNPLDQLN